MNESVSLFTAFIAGIVSFISPCVLPIVPGYLSFISGINVSKFKNQETPKDQARRVAITSLFFVLGFSTVFVLLGAAATMVGYYLQQYKRLLGMVGGAVIVVLGLHMMGIFRIKWLLGEMRAEVKQKPLGLLGAYVVGIAFAFGWTPCIGPILAGILLYASQQETVTQGVVLLSAYSAGLGIPFIAAGLAVNWFFAASAQIKTQMRKVEITSGVLLIGVGLLLVTDRLSVIAQWFTRMFPGLATLG